MYETRRNWEIAVSDRRTMHAERKYSLEEHALVAQEQCVVIPLHDIRQTIGLARRICGCNRSCRPGSGNMGGEQQWQGAIHPRQISWPEHGCSWVTRSSSRKQASLRSLEPRI